MVRGNQVRKVSKVLEDPQASKDRKVHRVHLVWGVG